MKTCTLNGDFIGVKEKENTFRVYKNFNITNVESAILRITALGLYYVTINGERVSKNYLTPGFTNYNKMLQVQEYDVLDLLKLGENEIIITVNEGWYSGRFGLDEQCKYFGTAPYVIASLKIEDKDKNIQEITTDETWKASQSEIVFSGIYDGEIIDYERKLLPLTTIKKDVDKSILIEQMVEPVVDKEQFKVKKVIRTPKGELVYDFGQNIAGVITLTPNKDKDVVLQFAEILDENGNFYLNNLRKAKGEAKIKIRNKKKVTFEFTYFGFRYVKIVTKNLEPKEIIAQARYSSLKETGKLKVENEKLNRFIQNTLWSQKDNFVDIPTDCPQRDERLGWTGDINAFCTTASYNLDIRNFMKKWLASLRSDQREDGTLPVVTPNVIPCFGVMSMWCDSAIMVPWKLYHHYNDITFLEDNYDMMKKYIKAKEANTENGLMVKGFEYGDWLALDSEEYDKLKIHGGTDIRYIGNVFYYHCLDLISKIANILGKKEDEEKYLLKSQKLLEDIRKEYFTSTGRLAIPTITGHVLALVFNIVPKEYKKRIAKELNENVIKHGYHVTTGFIGTPYLLFALLDNGYIDTVTKVILNEEYPGWIYEVNMGATTVWERWNSLLEDGRPNPDGMTSFNHYAYGSMVEFIYRRIAGIENIGLGFNKIKIMPHPIKEIGDVTCEYNSVSGKIISSFIFKDNKIIYDIQVPQNLQFILSLPNEEDKILPGGKYTFERNI